MGSMMIGGVIKKFRLQFLFFFQSETKDLLIIEKVQGKDERSSPTKYMILIKIRLNTSTTQGELYTKA